MVKKPYHPKEPEKFYGDDKDLFDCSPRPVPKHQGSCVKCDGYDGTCYSYRAYSTKFVSPCVSKWNQGQLEVIVNGTLE